MESSQVLVVDDEEPVRNILKETMNHFGYESTEAENGEEALKKLEYEYFDVVITDVMMPKIDGIELLKRIKANYDIDVIVMTGNMPDLSYEDVIGIGASDFLVKPASPKEIIMRLRRVIRERSLQAESRKANERLAVAHKALQNSYLETIQRLVLASEYKDEDTGSHIIRIGRYCHLLAEKLGLDKKLVKTIGYAAPMHDIGKIGIPDQIMLKPGKLTYAEFEIMKTHTTIGAKMLAGSNSDIIRCAQQIAISHHEKWNGKGYPQGHSGEKIPLTGRIVAIADMFDALISKRPYKAPYPLELVVKMIKKEKGKQLDPHIAEAFLDHVDDMNQIREDVASLEPSETSTFFLSERDIEK